MSDDGERFDKAMADAVQRVASEVYPGDLVTRWVVLVETINQDGRRGLIVSAQVGSKPWDTLGLLQHAVHLEQAATSRDDQ